MKNIKIFWFWLTKYKIVYLMNKYIYREAISAKGIDFFNYCSKILTKDYQPVSYKETMMEKAIKEMMDKFNCDRHSAATKGYFYALRYMPITYMKFRSQFK